MKQYPSIPKGHLAGKHTYLFDKYDGSNIRGEWSRKHKKFVKFGSRTQLIDKSTLILGESISLITDKYEKDLTERFIESRAEKAVCFFEFFGINSFAGSHVPEDKKEVVLLDISLHPKGIITPKDFLKITKGLDVAKLLFEGVITQEIIQSIENGTLKGMTFEGVIGKCNSGSPGMPEMFKIKNKAWLAKLKDYCKGDESLFEKLR